MKIIRQKNFILLCFGLVTATSCWSQSFRVGYDSLYISEGRRNIDGAIATAQSHLGSGPFYVEALAMNGLPDQYHEINLSTGGEWSSDPVTLGASLTYLRSSETASGDDLEADDTELTLSTEYSHNHFSAAIASVYSTEADGTFTELSVAAEVPLASRWQLLPRVKTGNNQNYIRGESDGFNHLQYSVHLQFHYAAFTLATYYARTHPLQSSAQDTLYDGDWAGLSLEFSLP